MSNTLRALSALLAYPTEDLRAAVADIGAVLVDEEQVSARERADLWPLLAELRRALRSDLDAPAALAAVDRWAEASLAGGDDADAPAQVRAAVDALLGIAL